MQFIDVQAIHAKSRDKIEAAISGVISHARYINGPEVYELETALGEFLGGHSCVAVSSGTAALEIALRALKIGPGDEVITTPFTWISSAETVGLVGATPVFADIDPLSYNLDPQAVEDAITEKTKAIIVVNLFGQVADMESLSDIAERNGLYLIEDAAQSLGAERNGKKSCTFGTISTTSFFPAKPLGCYGDGGAVFTPDPDLAREIRAIANHGGKTRGNHHIIGTNGRFDTIQAAIVLAKLPAFKEEIQLRRNLGQRYSEALAEACTIPRIDEGNTHVYAQYTIRPKDRDTLAAYLKEREIPTAVYYRSCLHHQKVFEPLGYKAGDFLHAEKAAETVISLPFHPYMTQTDQDRIIQAVIECETQ